MNFYVIKRNRKDYEIEKYTQEEWETVKEKVDQNNVVHITQDLNDPKIQYYELTEIIWGRIYNKCAGTHQKIYVDLTSDIDQMEKDFQERYEELKQDFEEEYNQIRQRKLERYKKGQERTEEYNRNLIEQFNKIIPLELEKDEALRLWKKYNFLMPPPDVISKYKSETNMSWTEFAMFVERTY